MVCSRMAAISLARAIMRAAPVERRSSTNGATDQPTSTWPDMTWVMVPGTSPSGLEAVFADEPQHRDVGGRAGGGICDALTIDLAHGAQGRLGGDPPKGFSRP